jgi:SAM-dependent methyltransferase
MKKAIKKKVKEFIGPQVLNYLLSAIIDIKGVYYSFGNQVQCPICNHTYSKFLAFRTRKNALCPNCRSLERHRLIYVYLKNNTSFFSSSIKVLHFAPERCLYDSIRYYPTIEYKTADLMINYMTSVGVKPDYIMSVTDIKFEDNSFDVIICCHVLTHVPNDQLAMREIFRVLKKGGYAIIQVPVDSNSPETKEDHSLDATERKRLYGGYDHYRRYGLDYKQRLERNGFTVTVDNYVLQTDYNRFGLQSTENIYLCRKI